MHRPTHLAADSPGTAHRARDARDDAVPSNRQPMDEGAHAGFPAAPRVAGHGGVEVNGTGDAGTHRFGHMPSAIRAQARLAGQAGAQPSAPVSAEALAARRPAAAGPTIVHVEIDRIDLRLPAGATPPGAGGKAVARSNASDLVDWLRGGRAPRGGRP